MKEIKQQKGITLIALIITIVVLLILAAVTIGTMQESNIVGMATNATTKYEEAKTNEASLLGAYETQLDALAAERVVFTAQGEEGRLTILPGSGKAILEGWNENGEKLSYEGTFSLETVTEDLLEDCASDGMPTSVGDYQFGIAVNFNTEDAPDGIIILVTKNPQAFYVDGTKLIMAVNTASNSTLNNAMDKYKNTISENTLDGNTLD